MDPTHGLPPMKRLLVETMIKTGAMEKEVVEEAECSRSTYYRYKHNIRRFDQPNAPSCSRMGRPSTFTEAMREVKFLALFSSSF